MSYWNLMCQRRSLPNHDKDSMMMEVRTEKKVVGSLPTSVEGWLPHSCSLVRIVLECISPCLVEKVKMPPRELPLGGLASSWPLFFLSKRSEVSKWASGRANWPLSLRTVVNSITSKLFLVYYVNFLLKNCFLCGYFPIRRCGTTESLPFWVSEVVYDPVLSPWLVVT